MEKKFTNSVNERFRSQAVLLWRSHSTIHNGCNERSGRLYSGWVYYRQKQGCKGSQCEQILQGMHQEEFCHGDFCSSNLLDTSEGKVVLDFDWPRKTGVTSYPHFMNQSGISWACRAKDGECLDPSHDDHFLQIMFWSTKHFIILCNKLYYVKNAISFAVTQYQSDLQILYTVVWI